MVWSTLIKAGVAIGATAITSDKISSAIEKSADKISQVSADLRDGKTLPVKKASEASVTSKCIGCHAPLAGKPGTVYKCPYCDTTQTLN